MRVRVRLFARARDLAGADVLTVDLPEGASAGDLRRTLAALHPNLAGLLERSALAVDEEFATDTTPVTAGSEVAVLPPVSGG